MLSLGGAAGRLNSATRSFDGRDVQSLVIPDTGHFVAEEAPEVMLAALTAFLAPYRSETLELRQVGLGRWARRMLAAHHGSAIRD